MTPSLAKQMAIAVQLWLDFQILCGREMLLSEAYLAQPIGEFLKDRHSGSIQTEWNHPRIKSPGPGRPKQIDYALFSRDKKRPLAAIEAKWINSQWTGKQRLLDDILRLECVRNDEKQPMMRYFLVAGRSADVQEKFFKSKINAGKKRIDFLEGVLPLDSSSKNVKVKNCDDPWRKPFKSFHESYRVDLPLSFKTTLIGNREGDSVRVLVWRISSVSKRTTFSPSDQWRDLQIVENDDDL